MAVWRPISLYFKNNGIAFVSRAVIGPEAPVLRIYIYIYIYIYI